MLYENVHLGNNVTTICKNQECTVFEMKSNTGDGIMTCYEVFPGIALLYNDFHMQSCHSEFQAEKDMFSIEHCREGRIEWNMGNDTYLYLGAGDLRIDNRKTHDGNFEFPLKHYHGITISLYGEEAEKSVKAALGDLPFKLEELQKKFCSKDASFVLRSQSSIDHIFSELYAVPNDIKKYYFKIKVLELILYLSTLEVSKNLEQRPYFNKVQVEKIKKIENFMTANLQKHYTLNKLADKFNISLTAMKTCFKGVYGMPIYTYIRAYRMNKAAIMLSQTQESIVSIAGLVGYDSHSKFSVAFKEVMGKSPLQYRKSIV